MGRNGADWEADFGAAIVVFEGVVVPIGAGDDFAVGEKFSFDCRLRSRAFLGAMVVAVRDVGLKASSSPRRMCRAHETRLEEFVSPFSLGRNAKSS
jgi:hypothetical protein